MIGVVTLRVEHAASGRPSSHTPSAGRRGERQVAFPWPCVPRDTGFDGNVARASRHQPTGREARGPAAAEGRGAGAAPGSTVQPTGLLGCGQCPGDEGLGTTRAASASAADAPKPDAQIVEAAHGTDACEVQEVSTLQRVAATCRLSRFVAHRAKCLMRFQFPAARPGRASRLLSCHRSVGCPSPRPHRQMCDTDRNSTKESQGAHHGPLG